MLKTSSRLGMCCILFNIILITADVGVEFTNIQERQKGKYIRISDTDPCQASIQTFENVKEPPHNSQLETRNRLNAKQWLHALLTDVTAVVFKMLMKFHGCRFTDNSECP
jgi:hypothetical protein